MAPEAGLKSIRMNAQNVSSVVGSVSQSPNKRLKIPSIRVVGSVESVDRNAAAGACKNESIPWDNPADATRPSVDDREASAATFSAYAFAEKTI